MWRELINMVRDLNVQAMGNLVSGVGSLVSLLTVSFMGEHMFLLIGCSPSWPQII